MGEDGSVYTSAGVTAGHSISPLALGFGRRIWPSGRHREVGASGGSCVEENPEASAPVQWPQMRRCRAPKSFVDLVAWNRRQTWQRAYVRRELSASQQNGDEARGNFRGGSFRAEVVGHGPPVLASSATRQLWQQCFEGEPARVSTSGGIAVRCGFQTRSDAPRFFFQRPRRPPAGGHYRNRRWKTSS